MQDETKPLIGQTEDEKQYNRRRKIISIISFIIMIALFAVVTLTIGKKLITLAQNPELFRDWVQGKGFLGKLAMIGISILQVVIAIIPGEVFEIGAGYAFGAIQGMVLCMIGMAIGSAVIYWFTKKLGIKMVEAFVSREQISSLSFIQKSKKLDLLIFILFFIPGTPKDILTYFIGLTPMKLHRFLLISSIARIPSIISSTMGGNAIGEENYLFAVAVFVVTAIISGIGILVYRKISKKKEEPEEPEDKG